MGGGGPGVFSDDLASDVRGGYRELLEDEVPDHEATRRVVAEYADLDEDEEPVLWLALAATQWSLGRLEEGVRAKALDIIDSGRDLLRWEESGPHAIAARARVLTALRDHLTSPQPARKPVRRPWGYVTDLDPGTVLGFRAGDVLVLLRVARLMAGRLATAPVVQRLEWTGVSAPARQELEQAPPMLRTGLQGPSTDMLVTKHRRQDPDWSEAGFELLGRTGPRRTDTDVMPILYTSWDALPRVLGTDVAERTPQR